MIHRAAVFAFMASILLLDLPVLSAEKEDLSLVARAFNDHLYDLSSRYATQFLEKYPESAERDRAEFILANSKFEKKEYADAVTLFKKISERAGSDYQDRSLLMAGESYARGGDPVLAVKYYENVAEKFPSSAVVPESKLGAAKALFAQGARDEAEKMLEGIVVGFPSHPAAVESQFLLGESRFEGQHFADAADTLKRFVDKYPLNARAFEAYYLLGETHRNLGDYSQALENFKFVLNQGKKGRFYVYVLHSIAWTYFQMERYAESFEAFTPLAEDVKGLEIEDSFFFGRARALQKLKRFPEAVQAFNKLIEGFLSSEYRDDAMLWLSEIHLEQEEFVAAQNVLERLLAEHAQSPLADDAEYNLGWAFLRMGQDVKAMARFKALAEGAAAESVKVRSLCTIADMYLKNGATNDAIAQYDKVLDLYPKSAYSDYAQYQVANLLLKTGNSDGAALGFQTLAANFPQSEYRDDALYGLGVACMRRKDYIEAASAFGALVDGFPESPLKRRAFFQRATSFYNIGLYDKALEGFERIAASPDGDDSDLRLLAQYQIGLIYFKLSKEDDGERVLTDLIASDPDSKIAAEVGLILGEHYMERGRYSEARARLEETARRFPARKTAGEAAFLAALAYRREGDMAAAVAGFKRVLEEYPLLERSPEAVTHLTEILVGFGRSAEAKEELLRLKSALRGPRTLSAINRRLGEILKSEGSLREAHITLSEALKNASETEGAAIQFIIGETLELEGRKKEAAAEYLKISYLYPKQKDLADRGVLQAAILTEAMGNAEEAFKLYRDVADAAGPSSDEARRRMKDLKKVTP